MPSATLGKHPFTDLYQLPARAASADGSDFLLGSEMLPQHGRERIVLSWDGTSFPATPAVISVFFIDRPLYKRNTTLFLIRKLEQGKCFA